MAKILVGKPEGKCPFGSLGVDNIKTLKIDSKDIGWEDVGWIYMTQVEYQWWGLVSTEINLVFAETEGIS
jgi:hypothetical protein